MCWPSEPWLSSSYHPTGLGFLSRRPLWLSAATDLNESSGVLCCAGGSSGSSLRTTQNALLFCLFGEVGFFCLDEPGFAWRILAWLEQVLLGFGFERVD